MSRRIADLLIKIGADSYEFQQKAKEVEKGLAGLEKKLTNVGKTLSMRLTAPLVALGAVSLKNADVQQQAESRLLNALKGRSDIQQRLLTQASELQSRSVLGDEVIIGQQAYLASLGMTEEQIGKVIEASAQLSAATGMTLESAVKNLAKTFGGLTGELGESIPKLKEFTTEQLKNGEAVDFILQNYKGFAETAAKEGLGAVKQLKNAWGDFTEQIGAVMIPAVNTLAKALSKVVAALQSMSPLTKKVIVTIGGVAASIAPLSLAIGGVIKTLPMMASGFTALLSPVGLVVTAILALGAAFVYAKNKQDELLESMTNEFEGLSLRTLESRLKENRRLQAVNENEELWSSTRSVASNVTYALNKGDRRRQLQMEEQALQEAIRRTKKAIDDKARAEREAAEISKQMEDALKGVSGQTQEQGGLINDLKNQIAALEKKKLLPESTVDDIAACNVEIEKLQKELKRLESIKPEDLLPKERLSSSLPAISLEIPAPKLTVEMGNLRKVVDQYAVQMQEIFTSVREGIYGWADDTNSMMQANFADMFKIVENYTAALTEKGWKFSEALEHVQSTMASTMQKFEASVSQFLADSIVAAADAIGQVIAGDLGFGGLMKAILTQLANFLKNIGAQLIEFGVMIVAFKSTLKSVLANPWAAIGVGAAMVAAAAVMTALINKNAQENVPALASGGLAYGKTLALVGDNANAAVDPEVIAPLSKLQAMLPAAGASQNINITLGGQLVAKGRDLAYVLNKENYKNSVMGG
ncbi:MAG: hypothetical protein IJN52_01645 [Bacteroidales bacterium]|nr:hypothetical protein [Bacteroidales bacterium]